MNFEDFTAKCDIKVCLRKRKYHEKGCLQESKRKDCYSKYEKVNNKQKNMTHFDLEEDILREDVWKRDANQKPMPKIGINWKLYCRFWRCLSDDERSLFLWLNRHNLWMCKNLDVAHLKSKGAFPELKYNVENCVLMNRLAHTRLDNYKDPITGFNIDAESHDVWIGRIRSVTK